MNIILSKAPRGYICLKKIMMIKKILVPTDFSDSSYAAIHYAVRIAQKVQGELHLLHVLDTPKEPTTFSVTGEWGSHQKETTADTIFMMGLLEQTKIKMNQIKRIFDYANLPIFDHIATGIIYEMVNDYVVKNQMDLLVVGTQGTKGGLAEFFIGSNAEKIIRSALIPVIAVKHKARKNPSLMAFASDFSEESDSIFPFAQKFADIFDAQLHLLKVNTPENFKNSRESRKQSKKFLKRMQNENEYPMTAYNDRIKEEGIIHFAQDHKVDLIIMGTHGNTGLSHFLNGSISEDIVNHAFCPVMTIRIS